MNTTQRRAKQKRIRRIERNIINEARQGREPEGLMLAEDGCWVAECRRCGESYELPCDAHEFHPDHSYCGQSEWCIP